MNTPLADLLAAASHPSLGPVQLIGVAIAVVGAVFMSLAAMLQHRGVARVDAASGSVGGSGLGGGQLIALLRQPVWLAGTGLIIVAICMQIAALIFAPLVVVQPLGVISLVVTTLITSRQSVRRMSRIKLTAVLISVLGIAAFVTVAAFVAVDSPITQMELFTVLIVLFVVVVALGAGFLAVRESRFRSLYYIVAGGALYGFVATLARVVIGRVREGDFGGLTILCVLSLALALAAGSYLVQTAYASGSPDLVVAGLTVIDPLVAVAIGIIVLGETAGAPLWALFAFVVFGAVSAFGVYLLAAHQDEDEVAAVRSRALGTHDLRPESDQEMRP